MLGSFACASGLLAQQRPTSGSDSLDVVDANNQFAFDLYRNLNAHEKGKNIFVSPFSISSALSMTYEGSSGNTRRQMAAVFHFTMPDARRQAEFSKLLAKTAAGPGKHYKLEVANALWGQKNFHFDPAFTHAIDMFYGGGFNQVDYAGDKPGSIKTINSWVESKTAGKIQNLIHPDDINALTRLVITNAIYFKGDWASPFMKSGTVDEPFHLGDGKTVQAAMMRQTRALPSCKRKRNGCH